LISFCYVTRCLLLSRFLNSKSFFVLSSTLMIRDIDQRLLIIELVVRTEKLQIIITKCICDSEMWWNWKKNAKPSYCNWPLEESLSVCSFSLSLICISHMQKSINWFLPTVNQLCTLHTILHTHKSYSLCLYSLFLRLCLYLSVCLSVYLSFSISHTFNSLV
jgi:hypothetical protein